MLDGGNAVDSAIATMYCNTVVNSQSMGIGESRHTLLATCLVQVVDSS